jgi:cation:H+ antiporter
LVWLKLVICCLIILFAGTWLARSGDAVSERTGLGRMWIGLILIGLVTSMPEMVTGVSSAAIVGQPDLALGNFWSSCIFNLTILAVLDIFHRRGPVLSVASNRYILPAFLGIVLISIAGISLLIGDSFTSVSLGWISLTSILIFAVYIIGIRQMFIYDKNHPAEQDVEEDAQYSHLSSRQIYGRFILAALGIIAGGIWLSFIGDEISVTYNLSANFVGSLFLAIATSLPEIVVAIDLAVGDILGANMLNTANIFVTDIFYTKGPLLADVSSKNLFTAAAMIIMTLIVIAGLKFKSNRKTFKIISWNALLILAIYIATTLFLFYH